MGQQTHAHSHSHPVLLAIDQAHKDGKLSLDERVLYKFYTVQAPSKLPTKFRTWNEQPIKCGTPIFADYQRNKNELSQATINEIEAMTTQSQPSETFPSPSGNFFVHYETTGEDAVPSTDTSGVNGVPDYVEFVAAAADSSYSHQIQNLGYTDPNSGGASIDVFIRDLTTPRGTPYGQSNGISIEIENDFSESFPPNDHPDGKQIGAINVTMAHELKHVIQFENNQWQGTAGGFAWSEMDATLMEEVTYDNVNDYYNYIFTSSESIFLNPSQSIPGAYWDVSFNIFFDEMFGTQFWVDVWQDEIKPNPNMDFLDAIKSQLTVRGEQFNQIFTNVHLWHFASGPENSATNYGFEERTNYPNPAITETLFGIQGSLQEPTNIKTLAANYFEIDNNGVSQDQVIVSLNTQTALTDTSSNISKIPLNYSVGAIAYFSDGSISTLIEQSSSGSGKFDFETPWDWSNINKIGLVILNQNEDSRYQLNTNIATGSYKQGLITLEQNYPNPFSNSTTIEFTLLQDSDVQLKIYDVTGRLVRTLIDGPRTAGKHTPTLSSERLASGVYFYQLITDKRSKVKKLTLIK